MPKISVIIPVYNVEKYLSRCLDSIVNQTFKDLEIICIDDGSPDKSAEILAQYAQKDKRIKVISQKNSGLSAARNVGLKCKSGDYVSFIDSDDYIDPNYYECLIDLIVKNNADIAMAGMRTVDGKNISDNKTKNFVTNDFFEKVKNLPNGSTCDKLFRADIFDGIEFPQGRYYEDNIILLKTIYNSNKMVFTNAVSYYYFINNSGICRTQNEYIRKKTAQDRLYSAETMMNFTKQHGFGNSKPVKDFILRTVIGDFISKKSPYYKQSCKILGWGYVWNIKIKKLLKKLAKFFYQNNSKIRTHIYKWRKK